VSSENLHDAQPSSPPCVLDEWRDRLHHLLECEQIIDTASQGTASASFARSWPRTPDVLVLRALAYEEELRVGLIEAGLAGAGAILDAGCGPGMITRLLAEVADADVVGIDMEAELLEFAESLPPPSRGRVVFEQGDVLTGLRMDDGQFDAVFVGDMWLPGMLAELRRVTRPGGLIVVKFSGVLPTLTYTWDRAFDLRMQQALLEGSRRCFGDADYSDGTFSQRAELADAGDWQSQRAFSVLIERFAPVPAVFEEVERQIFGRYAGPLINDVAHEDDWARLASFWDPLGEGYVFARPGGHFTRSLHFLAARLPKQPHRTRLAPAPPGA
jgi:SAM-dependent methyltransferase